MMAKATRATQSGYSITVEVVRDVHDKTLWADGWDIPVGREIVGWTLITLSGRDGRVVAKADSVSPLNPALNKDAAMQSRGVVGKLGDVWVTAETMALITEAQSEADAAEPGSDEFWALKEAQDEARRRAARQAEIDAPALREIEEFERRMDDPNSDL
jgi:hypothetical protein